MSDVITNVAYKGARAEGTQSGSEVCYSIKVSRKDLSKTMIYEQRPKEMVIDPRRCQGRAFQTKGTWST